MMCVMSDRVSKKDQEALELGKKLQQFIELGYTSRKEAFKLSFLKGLATGLGAFIGGTLVIAVLLWTLGRFESIPLVGPITQQVQDALKKPE